jgi:regulator of sirC expression with transglutaminase-like and TPR domain
MKDKDIHKSIRDSMDQTLEQKFMVNLQWSMLFFCFNQVANLINEENEFKEKHVQKEFIKTWKKFAHNNIAKSDLEIINNILNSPKNIFYSALQNNNEITESTEIYQEKYNLTLSKIEKFFIETLNTQQKFEPPEDNDDNEYA